MADPRALAGVLGTLARLLEHGDPKARTCLEAVAGTALPAAAQPDFAALRDLIERYAFEQARERLDLVADALGLDLDTG